MARWVRVPLVLLRRGEREIDKKTARYLSEVLRLRAGDRFIAFDPEARLEATAALHETDGVLRCVLEEPIPAARVVDSGIVLIQALGKGDKAEQVVRSATALGVARIVLVESERSVARASERSDNKRARLQTIALDAARQSGRGDVPEISGPHSLDTELELWREAPGLKLCLAPDATSGFRALTDAWTFGAPIALLIGPEGGFSAREIERTELAGFVAARFGELTLRTEIAGIAVLGALIYLSQQSG